MTTELTQYEHHPLHPRLSDLLSRSKPSSNRINQHQIYIQYQIHNLCQNILDHINHLNNYIINYILERSYWYSG
ncbi:hypothetical protein Tdes44962_MAKER04379 [Teratosphaeria destructans]|uniref:Uncharacterized protein n=1 Tax=Teratosphaeria destructans TaxID=418781 RepID=A0A9W7SMG0_9PEZI|nr:hypothetical protein Tdes44962_MAKER04379 [Teratosphaeria destructans]